MEKEPKDMRLGELVGELVEIGISYSQRLWTNGSPYTSKEEFNLKLKKGYIEKTEALKDELDKREKTYKATINRP